MDEPESSRSNRNKRKEIMRKHRETNYLPGGSSTLSPNSLVVGESGRAVRSRTTMAREVHMCNGPGIEIEPEALDLGLPMYSCRFCGALFWFAERLKSRSCRVPVFSLCCRQGRIKLPPLRDPPEPLNSLFDYYGDRSSRLFRANIRLYNSMFAFTSIGGKIDRDVNRGQGPYVFKLNGQNHHFIGSLLPMDGQRPQFAQLYIYDTENEVSNRLASFNEAILGGALAENLVANLIVMFDDYNQLVKAFRMARDRFRSDELCSFALSLTAKRSNDGMQYNAPTTPEMAGLIVGDVGMTDHGRDIIIHHRTQGLRRVDDLHPAFMSMQYPVLFPFGEDGYRLKMPYQTSSSEAKIKRCHITRREYYCYMLQQRATGNGSLLKGGKLYQQYIVDAFTCIEDDRLRYIRFKHQQEHYRCEIYSGVQDAFLRGDSAARSVGQRVILPSSFTGSPRYMIQNYHDAMAICRSRGNPDLFITFTCNVQWPEIQHALALIPGQKIEDRPDIVSRVFHMKLTEFMADIKAGLHFGPVVGAVYTVEFQKRGLPHVHIIVWLDDASKNPSPMDIDRIISAEIPDQKRHPILYKIVARFMMHGPCGTANPRAPCMKDGKCMKHFPRQICSQTVINEDGFAIYRREANSANVIKGGVQLDNRFVVPYNRQMLLKYDAHVNVEWCNRSRAIKYLFKYINKGPDRTRALLRQNIEAEAVGATSDNNMVDEINIYMDCRYVAPFDAIWRIFEFHIHYKFPTVESLTIHMPLMNNILFRGDQEINTVLQRPGLEKTMLTEWMFTNSNCDDARALKYVDFPTFWVWDNGRRTWLRRQRGQSIGRISYVHPSAGDVYYLRLLLSHVRGPRSYDEIRTVHGITYDTFKEACNALGLIGNDREWLEAIAEASQWATSSQLRALFITIILFCEVVDAARLLDAGIAGMQEDIIHRLTSTIGIPKSAITDAQAKDQVLCKLQAILIKCGSSLSDHKLPEPTGTQHSNGNTLLIEELLYDTNYLHQQNMHFKTQINDQQKNIYDNILDAVYQDKRGMFFVHGHGGTGKTFVYKAIINQLRSEGRVVLAVASSGIASLLLPGGRTAHSRFKIPIDIHDQSTCHIKKGTLLAELVKKTALIVWDEAPMAHRFCFEALDRTLRDILEKDDEGDQSCMFGGKTIILGGDFRQILPVVLKGTQSDMVTACITHSSLWRKCQLFELHENMRLSDTNLADAERIELKIFAQWILDVGEGKAPAKKMHEDEEHPNWIKIPASYLVQSAKGKIEDIVHQIYTNLASSYAETQYLSERAILTTTNETVDAINTHVLSLIPTELKTYLSYDSIHKSSGTTEEDDLLYPVEFLNSLTFNGIPNHELHLKMNTPVMLLRNINQSNGLCNGTRLMISRLGERVVQATIMTGSHVGDKICIPRIIMSATERKWPFTLKRRQFPLRLCYAMTINKSQGQTLNTVGIYLPKPVFAHGQLYVALSRVTTHKGLKILIKNQSGEDDSYTKNIVYGEIFDGLKQGYHI